MHHLLSAWLVLNAAYGGDAPLNDPTLSPRVCQGPQMTAMSLLSCIDATHALLSHEISGGSGQPLGDYTLEWDTEPLSAVLARHHAAYPTIPITVHDVGERIFLTAEPSFAGHTVTLTQTTFPDALSALDALVEAFQPEGMKAFHTVVNFTDLQQNPKPLAFREPQASMIDFMDQWLDAAMPHRAARWTLRCNTERRTCGVHVRRGGTLGPSAEWPTAEPPLPVP
jgi:hypothetical protein